MSLYVVATPIGNMSDLSFRAREVLGSADFIYSEDSRKTNNLLRMIGVEKKARTYHHHSNSKVEEDILNLLKDGLAVAIVTDAGTPGISDPGNKLISRIKEEKNEGFDIDIVPIPGVSALTTILSVCGFDTDDFYFLGFLPKKKGRQKKLLEIKNIKTVLVIFESPHRILKTLNEFRNNFGDIECVVGRELTKKFEEIVYGPISKSEDHFGDKKIKGEFVIVLNNRG